MPEPGQLDPRGEAPNQVKAERCTAAVLTAAMCCAASEQNEPAVTLYAAADQLCEAASQPMDPFEAIRHDADLAALESAVGEIQFSQLRSDGVRLTFEDALVVARTAVGIIEPRDL